MSPEPLKRRPLPADSTPRNIHLVDHNYATLREAVDHLVGRVREDVIEAGYDPRDAGVLLHFDEKTVAPFMRQNNCGHPGHGGDLVGLLEIMESALAVSVVRLAAAEVELEQLRPAPEPGSLEAQLQSLGKGQAEAAPATSEQPRIEWGDKLAAGEAIVRGKPYRAVPVDAAALHWCANSVAGVCSRALAGTARYCCNGCQSGEGHKAGCDTVWEMRRQAVAERPWLVKSAR